MPLPRLFQSKQIEAPKGGALSAAVLEFQSPSSIILQAPPGRTARNAIWVVAALLLTLLLISEFVPMDMEVMAQGQVISRAPTIQLEPLETAIVRSIGVHVGETVRAGQVLATLDPTEAQADLQTLYAQRSALSAEVAEERAEFEGKPYKPTDQTNRDQMLQAAIYAQRMAELRESWRRASRSRNRRHRRWKPPRRSARPSSSNGRHGSPRSSRPTSRSWTPWSNRSPRPSW
jgi:multidrug efflux pump subunit AcrA (membrane-fusion protein)